jgi:hypothetical protein
MAKVAKDPADVIEQAGQELTVCPSCQDSPKERFLNSQRFRIEIKVSAVYPDGSERGLVTSNTIIQGNLSQDDKDQLSRPNVPASAIELTTDEW